VESSRGQKSKNIIGGEENGGSGKKKIHGQVEKGDTRASRKIGLTRPVGEDWHVPMGFLRGITYPTIECPANNKTGKEDGQGGVLKKCHTKGKKQTRKEE